MKSKNDALNLSPVQVPVWSLKTAEPFKNLFPIRATVLSEIIDDMTVNGFDFFHPIVVWNMTVVDGHTRLKAAISAGIEEVSVICRKFTDEKEALEYAIRSQRNRRNLTDYELLQCLKQLDRRGNRGGDMRKKTEIFGKSANTTASILGISRSSIERLRAINDYATDEVKAAFRQGRYSIHRAYEETMRMRRPTVTLEPDADAELVHAVMADIHSRMNTAQIRKLVKALQLELAIN